MLIKLELRSGYKEYELRINNLFGLFFILLFMFQVLCLLSNKSGMFVMKSAFLV